ncbi:phytanoyl-CoA dioxygenase family protein [Hortaea werneckii]|nr:phytanoyl-CoA dioxygenase family protein [Hortaea werneckii]
MAAMTLSKALSRSKSQLLTRTVPIRCMSTPASTSTLPMTIKPTTKELSAGFLGERNLEKAMRGLHEDGLVVVSDVIPHDHLDRLNRKMVQDARTLQAKGKDMPYNYNVGNIQQDPPPVKEHLESSIFLNPIANQITTGMLGPRPKWTFCSGNSAMPPEDGAQPQRQPVHADSDFAHPSHPFALVVNVPLIRFTPENGSTETWLGTHTGDLSGLQVQEGAKGTRASGRIREDLLEQRRQVRGPSQPVIEKGSIVIRDLRLWHAGMPNMTDEVRVMLAMIHFAPWYRNPMKLELSEDLKDRIQSQKDLQIPVDWVSRDEALKRYLNRGFGNSYDFGQAE